MWIQPEDHIFQEQELLWTDQIDLIQQDKIRQRDLFSGDLCFPELGFQVLGINQSDDGIQACELLKLRDVQKSLSNRARIRNAGCFDQNIVEIIPFEKLLNALHQIFPDRTADASIAHLYNILGLRLDEFAVDTDLPDLINDYAEAEFRLLFEDVIEKSCLARTQETREHADRDHF